MRAILCTRYGPPEALELKEVEKPTPNENGVLVKIHAASLNTLDLQFKGGLARIWGGLRRPKDPRLGRDIAGQVEAVGSSVTRLKVGDGVFGVCLGGFAEYAATSEKNLSLKPANSSFEEAAAIPVAGITALQGLRDKGQIHAGQQVLIQGASGGVGTFAVQIAKAFGADVTAVCSPGNLDQAQAMGADHVIDYTQEDFTRSGKRYDLIFAVNGYHSIWDYRRVLSPSGIFILAGASKKHLFPALGQAMLFGPLMSRSGPQKMGFMGIADVNPKDLAFLKELYEAGKIKSIIEKSYPLNETGKALSYLDQGHVKGKIVIFIQ